MTPAVVIRSPYQLLVEGRTSKVFFDALARHVGVVDLEVHSFGGNTELRGNLRAFIKIPGFTDVKAVGLVRDAENDAVAAFQSAADALAHAGLVRPPVHASITPGPGRVNDFETTWFSHLL